MWQTEMRDRDAAIRKEQVLHSQQSSAHTQSGYRAQAANTPVLWEGATIYSVLACSGKPPAVEFSSLDRRFAERAGDHCPPGCNANPIHAPRANPFKVAMYKRAYFKLRKISTFAR